MIIFKPKANDFFLVCLFVISITKLSIALTRLIPTPEYKTRCEGVKNVSGVLSKCDVMSQLAPHIDKATPISAMENDTNGNFIVEISIPFDVFNSLVVCLEDKIVS